MEDEDDGLTPEQREAFDALGRELSGAPGIGRVRAESRYDSQYVLVVVALAGSAAIPSVSAAVAIRKEDLMDPKLVAQCLKHIRRIVVSQRAVLN